MDRSPTVAAISPALVKALGAIKGAAKDRKNPHFKNDYATLESVIDASRDVLAENGLCVIQGLGSVESGRLTVTTTLLHDSGEWMESEFQMPLAKVDPQGTGSAATYARRYALMAMLNVAPIDDDGEAATDRNATVRTLDRPTPNLGIGPEGPDWWGCDAPGMTAHAAKKDGWGDRHEAMREQLGELTSGNAWKEWCADNTADISKMPRAWRIELRAEAEAKAAELGVDLNTRRAA